MAEVFSNSMVAHVWAQQSQQHGRSSNRNFFFSGRALWSYGSHFLVGYIVAPGGPVFLNSDSYSQSTSGHQADARSATQHMTRLYAPALSALYDILRSVDDKGRITGRFREQVLKYLSDNWRKLDSESEAAAWLLRAIRDRRTWAAMRARLESAESAKAAATKEKARLAAIREGRALAARPWPEVRDKATREADSYCFRELRDTIGDFRASRLVTPKAHKRLRATLWSRENALRSILRRTEADGQGYERRNPGPRTKARAEVAKLRQWLAGRVGFVPGYDGPDGPGKLRAALELESGIGVRTLSNRLRAVLDSPVIPMAPATRGNLSRLATWADGLATVWEGEEVQRAAVRDARKRVLQDLTAFNRNRREYGRYVARGFWSGPTPVDPVTGGSYAPMSAQAKLRTLESILSRVPAAVPWGCERGFQIAPDLAARAARVAERAAEIAAELEPLRNGLQDEIDAEGAARRAAERAERERFAAMSADELRAAYQSGELGPRHYALADVSRTAGPLLRAVNPEVTGCNVTGGLLETSEGASVPLRHAFRVFQFVAHCRAAGKAWTPGAWGPRHIRVGHFTLDRIDSTGNFVAGCHSIKWPEVRGLAERLGVADCLADLADITAELVT